MSKGYLPLSRTLFENPLWTKPRRFSKFEACLHLLSSAMHSDCTQLYKGKSYAVGRGEFLTSVRKLAKKFGWGKSSVARYLRELEESGQIVGQFLGHVPGHQLTKITICNYEEICGSESGDGTIFGTVFGTRRKNYLRSNYIKEAKLNPRDIHNPAVQERYSLNHLLSLSTLSGIKNLVADPKHEGDSSTYTSATYGEIIQ